MDVAKSGLSAALLVQQAESKDLFVNLDPQILTLVRETECMSRLGLEVPHGAKQLRAKQDDLKDTYNKLSVSPCRQRGPQSIPLQENYKRKIKNLILSI